MKGIKKWLSIAALLLTTAVALLTQLAPCLEQPPEGALATEPSVQCDVPTVLGAIIASIGDAVGAY